MKNIISWRFLSVFAFAILVLAACEKDDMVKLSPEIATIGVENITSTSAVVKGYVIAEGDGFKEHGVAYGLEKDPTVEDNKAEADKVEKALYTATVSGLEYLTTYHVRAYSIGTDGTVYYGSDTTFTTLANVPAITIGDITGITATSATVAATVTDDGKDAVTARGFCWSMVQNPTIENDTTMNGTGEGDFTGDITGLIGGNTYYVRAYATNAMGTAYSEEKSFETPVSVPLVLTKEASNLSMTSAVLNGDLIQANGADITEKGFYWGLNANPTESDNVIVVDGTELGEYSTKLTGLTNSTTYHVRAYAKNSEGTAYGDDVEFTTTAYPTELYMTGDGVGLDEENWNWYEPLQMIPVHSHPELFWKIVWMKGSGGFKIAPEPAWGNDFGITGSPDAEGVYSIGSDNIPVPATAGYYIVVVDFNNSTVQVTEPKVYGIGNAFGGWDTNQASNLFTIDNTNKVLKFDNLSADGELRMYASASTLVCDWWQAEFIIIDGKIAYRGTGDDQTRVSVEQGNNVILNFKLNTGAITTGELHMTGEALGGWDWTTNNVQLTKVSAGIYEATSDFSNGGAFRFFGQADWSPLGYNYPFFNSVDALFENANDGDSNFRFIGTTGTYKVTVNLNNSSVTMQAVK